MKRTLAMVLVGLGAACGGGGGDGGGGGGGFIPLDADPVFAPWSGAYKGTFDVTGSFVDLSTNTTYAVTGTLEISDLPGTLTSAASGVVGMDRRQAYTLSVGGSPFNPVYHDAIEIDVSNNWFSLGEVREMGGSTGSPCDWDLWWDGFVRGPLPPPATVDSKLFLHGPTVTPGEVFFLPPSPVADCLGVGNGGRSYTREVVGTEVVTVPFGAYECWRVEEEYLTNCGGFLEQRTTTSWIRPELGLVAEHRLVEYYGFSGIGHYRMETDAKLTAHEE